MENDRVNILDSFAIISKIMPYYGWTHKYFLVLSQLWSSTRSKLDEFYHEFRMIKEKSLFHLKISSLNIDKLFFPNDLFTFEVELKSKEDASMFILFIKNLQQKDGWYFNDNYMHEDVSIFVIHMSFDLTNELEPYVGAMKSIKNSYTPSNYQFWRKSNTLFDWISLIYVGIFHYRTY